MDKTKRKKPMGRPRKYSEGHIYHYELTQAKRARYLKTMSEKMVNCEACQQKINKYSMPRHLKTYKHLDNVKYPKSMKDRPKGRGRGKQPSNIQRYRVTTYNLGDITQIETFKNLKEIAKAYNTTSATCCNLLNQKFPSKKLPNIKIERLKTHMMKGQK